MSPSAQTLFTSIETTVGESQPPALTVLKLESVVRLDELLLATNQVRDEFRNRFRFPLILWVTDEILKKLVKLAPDFYSWAAAPISFLLTPEQLAHFLHRESDAIFSTILKTQTSRFIDNSALNLNVGSCRRPPQYT